MGWGVEGMDRAKKNMQLAKNKLVKSVYVGGTN